MIKKKKKINYCNYKLKKPIGTFQMLNNVITNCLTIVSYFKDVFKLIKMIIACMSLYLKIVCIDISLNLLDYVIYQI